jgi:hypothetical protein
MPIQTAKKPGVQGDGRFTTGDGHDPIGGALQYGSIQCGLFLQASNRADILLGDGAPVSR